MNKLMDEASECIQPLNYPVAVLDLKTRFYGPASRDDCGPWELNMPLEPCRGFGCKSMDTNRMTLAVSCPCHTLPTSL